MRFAVHPHAWRERGTDEYLSLIDNGTEKIGASWTVWCFDPHWSPQLIKDWEFTPTRQGDFFMKEMTRLNR